MLADGGRGEVVNRSGGLLSKGEPLGASALGQVVELVGQLRGTGRTPPGRRAPGSPSPTPSAAAPTPASPSSPPDRPPSVSACGSVVRATDPHAESVLFEPDMGVRYCRRQWSNPTQWRCSESAWGCRPGVSQPMTSPLRGVGGAAAARSRSAGPTRTPSRWPGPPATRSSPRPVRTPRTWTACGGGRPDRRSPKVPAGRTWPRRCGSGRRPSVRSPPAHPTPGSRRCWRRPTPSPRARSAGPSSSPAMRCCPAPARRSSPSAARQRRPCCSGRTRTARPHCSVPGPAAGWPPSTATAAITRTPPATCTTVGSSGRRCSSRSRPRPLPRWAPTRAGRSPTPTAGSARRSPARSVPTRWCRPTCAGPSATRAPPPP